MSIFAASVTQVLILVIRASFICSVVFSVLSLTESLGERVVLDFQFSDQLILVRSHGGEHGFVEQVSAYRLTLLNYVQPGNVLVHRVENDVTGSVEGVVGQLELMKRDDLFSPL